MTPERLVALKNQLQQEISDWEKKLQTIILKQKSERKLEKLAALILEYDQIEREIEDRSHVFSVLSEPEETLTSPFIKSQWYSYIEAAETVTPEVVESVMDRFSPAIRAAIEAGEDDTPDLIQSEFKEYILPGQILAGHPERLDGLVMEMNAMIRKINPNFNSSSAHELVFYAFQKAINLNVRIEPIAEVVKAGTIKSLTVDERNALLDQVEERAAVLRFEASRKQNVAMEKALELLAKDK